MKRGRQGEGGGRPKKVIDYETVEKLAALQCTQQEIAAFLKISTVTLGKDEKFLSVYKDGIEHGRMSLRRHQWRALEAGNTTMLVWLGKQYLGQKDQQQINANITDERSVVRAPNPSESPQDWSTEYGPVTVGNA